MKYMCINHELLKAGTAPKPNSKDENDKIQFVRLALAIRDYMRGGDKPKASDFDKLVKDGKPSVDGESFDGYVDDVTKHKQPGGMELAGVVEHLYNLPASLENPEKPELWQSGYVEEYREYSEYRRLLNIYAVTYEQWLHMSAPNTNTNNSGNSDDSGNSGDSDGEHGVPGAGTNSPQGSIDWHDGTHQYTYGKR